jgi:Fe2+ transport system protein FeoA
MSERKLSHMRIGEQGRIKSLDVSSPEKLYEMGFLPGSLVSIKQIAPLGDPLHVVVEGYDIALRKEEADWVCVELENEKIAVG